MPGRTSATSNILPESGSAGPLTISLQSLNHQGQRRLEPPVNLASSNLTAVGTPQYKTPQPHFAHTTVPQSSARHLPSITTYSSPSPSFSITIPQSRHCPDPDTLSPSSGFVPNYFNLSEKFKLDQGDNFGRRVSSETRTRNFDNCNVEHYSLQRQRSAPEADNIYRDDIAALNYLKSFNSSLVKVVEKKPIKSDKDVVHRSELDHTSVSDNEMSGYQEEKNHHKRHPTYGDYNPQWDYLNVREGQSNLGGSRRGHVPYGSPTQGHGMGWNPMAMTLPHQGNPYYSNPHMDRSHMMPAHAHTGSDYNRYTQWGGPKMQRDVHNLQNAHTQRSTTLPQQKTILPTQQDIKIHGPSQNVNKPSQDFNIPAQEFTKMRSSPHDLIHRTPPPDINIRTPPLTHPEYPPTLSPSLRHPPTMKTSPPLAAHNKNLLANPLSDLQMLVTNQEQVINPQRADGYQQESVDLSAHSENNRNHKDSLKENTDKDIVTNVTGVESEPSLTVIQCKNTDKEIPIEKPVELTAKSVEKQEETEEVDSSEVELKTEDFNLDKAIESEQTDSVSKEVIVEKSSETSDKEKTPEPENTDCEVKEDTETISEVRKSLEEDEIARELALLEGDCKEANKECEDNKIKEEFVQDTVTNTVQQEEEEEEREEPTPKVDSPLVDKEATTLKDDIIESKDILLPEDVLPVKEAPPAVDEEPVLEKKDLVEEKKPPDNKKFIEVETELEKMFAGLEDEEGEESVESIKKDDQNESLPTVSSTSDKPVQSAKKSVKKRPARRRISRVSSGNSTSPEPQIPKSKKRKDVSKKLNEVHKKRKSGDLLETSRKGPVLRVEGSRENPLSVTVLNFPKGDDDDEKERGAGRKLVTPASRKRVSHLNELNYRGKSRNGLFSSTLSARYDAHSADRTWVCVFCKLGPHRHTSGDLFGPYVISREETPPSAACDYSGDEKDITDAQKRGGRNKRSLRANNMVEHFQKMSKKLKRTQSSDIGLYCNGMSLISNKTEDDCEEVRYEVWVHEQCVVWAAGVYLVSTRLVGLQEAIWSSIKTMCSKCGETGANLGCVRRNCLNRAHYPCAYESGWALNQETLIATCQVHKPRT